jgi:hypothetical protein
MPGLVVRMRRPASGPRKEACAERPPPTSFIPSRPAGRCDVLPFPSIGRIGPFRSARATPAANACERVYPKWRTAAPLPTCITGSWSGETIDVAARGPGPPPPDGGPRRWRPRIAQPSRAPGAWPLVPPPHVHGAPLAMAHGPQAAFIRARTRARAQVTVAPSWIALTRQDPRSPRRWKKSCSVPANVYLCGKTPIGTSPRRRGLKSRSPRLHLRVFAPPTALRDESSEV